MPGEVPGEVLGSGGCLGSRCSLRRAPLFPDVTPAPPLARSNSDHPGLSSFHNTQKSPSSPRLHLFHSSFPAPFSPPLHTTSGLLLPEPSPGFLLTQSTWNPQRDRVPAPTYVAAAPCALDTACSLPTPALWGSPLSPAVSEADPGCCCWQAFWKAGYWLGLPQIHHTGI